MIKGVATYNDWRHFTFIYPGIIIISGVGLSQLTGSIQKQVLRVAFVMLCICAMLHPVIWSVKNHPYEYTYFNELEGGFKNAYYNYETDYWNITVKKDIDWLLKNEPVLHTRDTLKIISNAPLFADYYIRRNYPGAKIKIIDGSFHSRSGIYWTYGIFSKLYLYQSIFNNDFPPIGTIHTEDIDGLPKAIILKDTNRYDFKAIEAIKANNYTLANTLFDQYLKYGDANNASVFNYIAIAKAMNHDYNTAIIYGQKAIQSDNNNCVGYLAIGLSYYYQNKMDEAVYNLKKAYAIYPAYIAPVLQQLDPSIVAKIK